jgi:hypothetical protein
MLHVYNEFLILLSYIKKIVTFKFYLQILKKITICKIIYSVNRIMHCLQHYASVQNFRSGKAEVCQISITRYVADKIICSNCLNYIHFFNLYNYIFCLLIHALSPTLRKCAKFQIDWKGSSV